MPRPVGFACGGSGARTEKVTVKGGGDPSGLPMEGADLRPAPEMETGASLRGSFAASVAPGAKLRGQA